MNDEIKSESISPQKPLSVVGDDRFIKTIYCKENNTLFISLHPDFIKKWEYVELMVKKLTAPNRERYKDGIPT